MLLCLRVSILLSLAGAFAACGPDFRAIDNRLREENLQQGRQISSLKDQLANRDATIGNLQSQVAGTTPRMTTLPPARLAQLFTASQLQIQAQTDVWDFGAPEKEGEAGGKAGFRVFIRTLTDDGQIVPATGTLTIEAFELPAAPTEPRRIGAWTFTPEEMKKSWYGILSLNHFALSCPWTNPPTLPDVTFKARFVDALTGQTLVAQLNKRVTLAAK